MSLMSSMPRCDAASISTTSREVPFAMVTHRLHVRSGSGVGPVTQLRPLARMRASEVFPVPRGPANRYACRTWPWAMALRSVRTTWSWPTTWSKLWGRYFRYSAGTLRFKQTAAGNRWPRAPARGPRPGSRVACRRRADDLRGQRQLRADEDDRRRAARHDVRRGEARRSGVRPRLGGATVGLLPHPRPVHAHRRKDRRLLVRPRRHARRHTEVAARLPRPRRALVEGRRPVGPGRPAAPG